MKQGIWALGALVMASVGAPVTAAPKEPLRLAPSSKWHANYAADSCRLARSFGTGKQEVVFALDRFQPGPAAYMTLIGRPIGVSSDTREAVILFAPNEAEQPRTFEVGKMPNGLPAVIVIGDVIVGGNDAARVAAIAENARRKDKDGKDRDGHASVAVPDIDPARNDAVTSMEIRLPSKQPVLLETGSMGAPMKALAACTDDLLRGWKIDVEVHRNLSRRATPAGNPANWMTSNDYPALLALRGQQGIVYFRLIVDAAGKPASCHIQQSTRPVEFDDAVCKGIMRRASFEPALDAAGKPVVSYYLNRVRFHM